MSRLLPYLAVLITMLAASASLPGQSLCTPEMQFLGENAGDCLGAATACVGDLDGDGVNDFLIGAPSKTGVGRAYLYSGADGSLIRGFTGEGAADQFGHALCTAGDVDNDQVNDLLIGAYRLDDETGRVYLYSGATGGLLHSFDGARVGDKFGFSVGSAGDLNQDDHDDILIGAVGVDSGVTDCGQVYIYSGADYAVIDSIVGSTDFEFGWQVGSIGDITDDDIPEVIISQVSFYANKGRVCVYSGVDLTLIAEFTGERVGDKFGYSFAPMADVTDDGYPDLVVGAPLYDG